MEKLNFSEILLDEEKYKEYNVFGEKDRFLKNLSNINIFVGINNAGKSRLIRKIFCDEDLKFRSNCIDLDTINKNLWNFMNEFKRAKNATDARYFNNISTELVFDSFPHLSRVNPFHTISERINKAIKMFNADNLKSVGGATEVLNVLTKYQETFSQILPQSNGATILGFERIYIPTLRGLRPVQIMSSGNNSFDGHQDNYKHRTAHDYFKDLKIDNIFTGLSFYDDLDKHLRGDPTKRTLLREFERFLSQTFFNNRTVELIPTHSQDVVNVKIGDHEDPIFHLGDGIQQIIILTYPLFFKKGKNLKVFYEEPDSNLHPGFQRVFLETIMLPEFSENQYFISTHSNHFLDMTLDKKNISIYTCEQLESKSERPVFQVTNIEGADQSVLNLLGVKNSSVFLSNCTLWVEGITDRIYLRKYLEIYQRDAGTNFLEDIHFSFVEYGGNNITHWSFLDDDDPAHKNIYVDRLCGRLFLVTDSDNAGFKRNGKIPKKSSKKARRFEQLKEKLGDRFYCLKCREIENLLTPTVLTAVIGEYEGRTINNGDLKKNYANVSLGQFIDDNLQNLNRSYSTDSGTIMNKVDFAKKAERNINSLADMSEEAVDLAKALHFFISSQNK